MTSAHSATAATPPDRDSVVAAPELVSGDSMGRYVIVRTLGAGGMGVVYVAHDPELDRTVALKVLHLVGGEDERRARASREAQALARLSHPGVVPVFDVNVRGPWLYLAMELVDGDTLTQWLAAAPRKVGDIVRVFAEAGRALEAAHRAGLVHRDFKPGNVMIDRDGRVRVLDFGLAIGSGTGEGAAATASVSTSGTLTRTGVVMGTPYYMAPEQHDRRAVDARADQYALCVALAEALWGVRPFRGDLDELAARKRTGLSRPPSDERVPVRLWRIVRRGLSPRPEDRFADMGELCTALERGAGRSWRIAWLGGGTAVVAAIAFAPARANECDTQSRVDRAWIDRRDDVRTALVEHSGWGDHAWVATATALDAWTGEWAAAWERTCETPASASRLRPCLAEQLAMVETLVDLLARGDARAGERAAVATSSLPRPSECTHRAATGGDEAAPTIALRLADARALAYAGHYDEQRAAAADALAGATAQGDPSLVGRALYELADAHAALGQLDDAARHASDAVWSAAAAGDDRTVARAAIEAAGVALRRTELEEARTWIRHAQAAVARLSDDDETVADVRRIEGEEAFASGRFDEALAKREHAILLLERRFGAEHVRVATALRDRADTLRRLGRHADAQATDERAVELVEAAVGEEHPLLADTLVSLGGALYSQRRFEEARPHLERAIAIHERTLGPEHPELLTLQSNLSLLLHEVGERERALTLSREVLAARERTLGDSLELAESHHNLGNLLFDAGDRDAALVQHERAVAIMERIVGPDHPDLAFPLTALGRGYWTAERYDDALATLERARVLLERSGSGAELRGAVEFSLARALWDRGHASDKDRAFALARSARDRAVAVGEPARAEVEGIEGWLVERGAPIEGAERVIAVDDG